MSLTIRAYNVRFGDAILITWDEDDREHHAWVDFGNFPNDPNTAFPLVYEDVVGLTGGGLDLAVVTHRHLDHLEGFYSLRDRFAADFQIGRLWHAHVTPGLDDVFKIAADTVSHLLPERALAGEGLLGGTFLNNEGDLALGLTTQDRMKEILATLPVEGSFAVHRQLDLSQGAMPDGIERLRIEVLAPEEDSGVYLQPLQDALAPGARISSEVRTSVESWVEGGFDEPSPFEGLADFERLRRKLRTGGAGILAAADKTRNNTSIVLRLTYDDTFRVLLTGDAEERSWEVMRDNGADLSSDALKVGHHGSINASPDWSFDRVFPGVAAENAAIVSTDPTRFDKGPNEVPKAEVVAGWTARLGDPTRFLRTDDVGEGTAVAVTFEA